MTSSATQRGRDRGARRPQRPREAGTSRPRSRRGDASPPPPRETGRTGPHDPLWAKILVGLGALLMMASGGLIVGGKILIQKINNSVNTENLLGADSANGGKPVTLNGPLNIVLVGLDERPDNGEPTRADSIILMHVSASHDQAYLISIPRDLWVTIPVVKQHHPTAEQAKINAAFAYGNMKGGRQGGMIVLAETLKSITGIRDFNAAAIVNFGSFEKLVAALGGVDMCLDQATYSHHIGTDKTGNLVAIYNHPGAKPVHYDVGCRHLEAWQALDYVRQRYDFPNTDYDRARHQQQFVKAVIKRAKSQGLISNPTKAIKIMSAAGEALTVDTRGKEPTTVAFTLQGILANELVMLKINSGTFHGGTIGGQDIQSLDDTSKAMLAAVKSDQLESFIAQNPGVVTSDIAS